MGTSIIYSNSNSSGTTFGLSTGATVRLYPVVGNRSNTPLPTGMRKRTRKLAAWCSPGISPTEGGNSTWPSDYEIELCLAAFGYQTYPYAPYWVDDNGNIDYFSLMESVDLSQSGSDGEGQIWDITIEFSPWQLDNNNINPLLQTPNVSWSFEQNEYPTLYDVNGKYICNSAYDAFLPGLSIKYALPVLQFRRNEATFNPTVAQQYILYTNSDTFLGAPANTVLIRDIRAELVKSIYGFYYAMEYEFAFNFSTDNNGNVIGWSQYVLDAGLNQLTTVSGTTVRIPILAGGATVTVPVPLSNGTPLSPGGTPVYMTFQTYPSTAFAGLNIKLPA